MSQSVNSEPHLAQPHAGPGAVRSARIALVTLTAINLLNYLDRYLVAGIVAPLKEHFDASDSDIGLLTSVFLLVYLIASPIFGILARRSSRTLLIAGGVMVWSLATIGSGLANTLTQLLIARGIVGIGEAAYSTIGPAILADHYPPTRRPIALSIFYAAIPIGSALSYIASGMISENWGWRAVFLAGGVPGIALAIMCMRLNDPPHGQYEPRGQHDGSVAHLVTARSAASIWNSIRALRKSRDYAFATAGYIAFTFAFGALAVWFPYYMQSVRGWSLGSATLTFGIVLVATGFVGTIGGGWIASRLAGGSTGHLRLCAICMAVACPASILALYCTADWLILAGLAVASTFSFATQGPVNTVIINAVDATLRPFAIGTSVLLIHLFGDVPSPWIIGKISDSLHAAEGDAGMIVALALIPVAMALSAAIWFWGSLSRGADR